MPRRAIVVLLLSCGGEVACGGEAPSEGTPRPSSAGASLPPPPRENPAAAPAPSAAVEPRAAGVEWFPGTLAQARALAKTRGANVLLDVGAYWCAPCLELEVEVFGDPALAEQLAPGYVTLHVDAEKGEGPDLVERYDVRSFPTVLVVGADGLERGRTGNTRDAAALLAGLAEIAGRGDVVAALEDDLATHPDELFRRFRLARALLATGKRDAAAAHLEALEVGDPKGELGLMPAIERERARGLAEVEPRDLEAAIAVLQQVSKRYPDSLAARAAPFDIASLQLQAGHPAEAGATVRAVVAANPDSARTVARVAWFCVHHEIDAAWALAEVDRISGTQPDDVELHAVRAELLHALGRDAEAVDASRRAGALEPETQIHRHRAELFAARAEDR